MSLNRLLTQQKTKRQNSPIDAKNASGTTMPVDLVVLDWTGPGCTGRTWLALVTCACPSASMPIGSSVIWNVIVYKFSSCCFSLMQIDCYEVLVLFLTSEKLILSVGRRRLRFSSFFSKDTCLLFSLTNDCI
jgi:hypothetical protein